MGDQVVFPKLEYSKYCSLSTIWTLSTIWSGFQELGLRQTVVARDRNTP